MKSAKKLNNKGRLIGIDQDEAAIQAAAARLHEYDEPSYDCKK